MSKLSDILVMNARRCGKTTAMIKAALSLKGILLVGSSDEAKRLKAEHGVDAISIGSDLDRLRGQTKAILIDPHAVAVHIYTLESQLTAVTKERDELKRELSHQKSVRKVLENALEQVEQEGCATGAITARAALGKTGER